MYVGNIMLVKLRFLLKRRTRIVSPRPQIVIFVGTVVKSFRGLSLTGSSPCKWYINPQVQEVKKLMASAKAVHQPITWTEDAIPSQIKNAAQKKISDIKNLNPFQCKARPSSNKRVAKGLSAEEQGGESVADSGGSEPTAAEDSPTTAA